MTKRAVHPDPAEAPRLRPRTLGCARRHLFVALGAISVALGVLGIALPFLPTTPFLLLAGYLFARSSARLHRWLLRHRHLGPYIHAFRNNSGLTTVQKLRIAGSFTVLLGLSAYFVPMMTAKVGLLAFWLFWMAWLLRMRTVPAPAVEQPRRSE